MKRVRRRSVWAIIAMAGICFGLFLCLPFPHFSWAERLLDSEGFLLLAVPPSAATGAGTLPDPALLQSAYAGGERFRFVVTWLGVPAGELIMELRRQSEAEDQFALQIRARTTGLLASLYPVEDLFLTEVRGPMRLPVRHSMEQREGRRQNSRLSLYDQEGRRVSLRKNDGPFEVYAVEGPVHNEFSAFFLMRTLSFAATERMLVPTFADKKRHEVVVALEGRETEKTIFGERQTIRVRPILSFKGLYDKIGSPTIWLTDDSQRIPVKIAAKILIGSLTASLVEYSGPSQRP